MRIEIPECRRCCCCFPLRKGILVFGYLNLLFSILVLLTEIFIEFDVDYTVMAARSVLYFSTFWYAAILIVSDVIFNIVLLVGAHTKRTRLLRVYYYYGITTTLLCLVSFLALRSKLLFKQATFYVVDACFVFTAMGLQVYLILLVRSELVKLRQRSRVCYINHAAEIIVDSPELHGNTDFETITLKDETVNKV